MFFTTKVHSLSPTKTNPRLELTHIVLTLESSHVSSHDQHLDGQPHFGNNYLALTRIAGFGHYTRCEV